MHTNRCVRALDRSCKLESSCNNQPCARVEHFPKAGWFMNINQSLKKPWNIGRRVPRGTVRTRHKHRMAWINAHNILICITKVTAQQ